MKRISQKGEGKTGHACKRLSEIFRELEEQGAHNINLVTAAHFVPAVLDALSAVQTESCPIVYNSSGYESVETLRMLDGAVDIYLPDYKYIDPNMAAMLLRRAGLSGCGARGHCRDGAADGRARL